MREPDILPPELARKWPMLRFVRRVSPVEFHAECPMCSDSGHVGRDWPDRFFMRTDGSPRGFCRRCGYQAFADEDKRDFVITSEMRAQWLEERLERERIARARMDETLELLKREQTWLRYYNSLTAEAVCWWGSKGVETDVMAYLKLGWCEARSFWDGQIEFTTPTATIPVWSPGWQIQNLRHRLVHPTRPDDKYRPDRAGLPASLYHANPNIIPQGRALIVEGEIKSIVVCDKLDGYNGHSGLCVVGTPGKQFRKEILDIIKAQCDRVYIALDPDAKAQAWDTARYIGKAARVVYLPCKPDDFFTQFGGTRQDFEAALRYGRQI